MHAKISYLTYSTKRVFIYIAFKLINSLIKPSHNAAATQCQEFVMRVSYVMSCLFLMWIGGTIKSGWVSECANHPGWFALWWRMWSETLIHTGLVFVSGLLDPLVLTWQPPLLQCGLAACNKLFVQDWWGLSSFRKLGKPTPTAMQAKPWDFTINLHCLVYSKQRF